MTHAPRVAAWRSMIVSVVMCFAAVLAVAARPTQLIKEDSQLHLEQMVPKSFGDWRIDESIVPIAPPPELKAVLDKTYDQTLSRTYINSQGQRIMLSIAYGGKHDEGMQTHRPEVCYPAQGFQVFKEAAGELLTRYGTLPIKRLVATQGPRNEPITYWVVVGDQQTRFGLAMKLAQVKYGLTGKIPDGMLVRVSSIDRNDEQAYQLQEAFVGSMLATLSDKDRAHIAGRFGA